MNIFSLSVIAPNMRYCLWRMQQKKHIPAENLREKRTKEKYLNIERRVYSTGAANGRASAKN